MMLESLVQRNSHAGFGGRRSELSGIGFLGKEGKRNG